MPPTVVGIGGADIPPGGGGDVGTFELGFELPPPPCIPEVLLPVGETVEGLRTRIDAEVRRCLAAGLVDATRCQACVNAVLADHIARATAACDRLGLACGNVISALYAIGWETAAGLGCVVPIALEYDPGEIRACPPSEDRSDRSGKRRRKGPPDTGAGGPGDIIADEGCTERVCEDVCVVCPVPPIGTNGGGPIDPASCTAVGPPVDDVCPAGASPTVICRDQSVTCPPGEEPPPPEPPPPEVPPEACPCPEGFEVKEIYCCPDCGENQAGPGKAPPGGRIPNGSKRLGPCGPYPPDGEFTFNCGTLQRGSPLPYPAEVHITQIGAGTIIEVFPTGTVFNQDVLICTYCPVGPPGNGEPPDEEPPPDEIPKCKKCCTTCVPKGTLPPKYPQPPPPPPYPYPYPYPTPGGDGSVCPPAKPCPPPTINIPPCPPDEEEGQEYFVGHDCDAKRCVVVTKRQKVDDARFAWYGPFKKLETALARAQNLCPPETCPSVLSPGNAVDISSQGWDNPEYCKLLERVKVEKFTDWLNFTTAVWGLRSLDGRVIETEEQRGATWMGIPFGKIFVATFRWFTDTLGIAIRSMTDLSGCRDDRSKIVAQTRMGAGLLSMLAGPAYNYTETPVRYLHQYYCPLELPGTSEILNLHLTGQIDAYTYLCWMRAQGRLPTPSQMLVRAQRAKLSPGEITQLRLRGLLSDAEMDHRLRELGYLDESDGREFRKLAEQIPVLTDITRFLVRDVDDEVNIDWSVSDEIFGDKWGGQLREWAAQQGIGEKFAKYYWRAHWQLPSPTQLYEMLHRLRHEWIPENLRVDDELIKKVLQQDDKHPDYVDRLMAISFRPLTRMDTRRSFEIGELDREGVRRSYLDQGYSDQNAEQLTKFSERALRIKHTNNRWLRLWGSGAVNREVAERRAKEDGLREEDVEHVFGVQLDLMRSRSRTKCIAAVRRRALLGEIERLDVVHELENLGLDQEQALVLSEGILCELQARGKLVPTTTLCQWFEDGLIDGADYLQRLERLGWEHDDAILFIRRCRRQLEVKQAKEEEKRLRDEERRRKALERERKAAEREDERRREKAARAAEVFRKAKEKREDLLIDCAVKVHALLGLPIKMISDSLRDCAAHIKTHLGVSTDDAFQAVCRAAESGEYSTLAELCLLAEMYAESELQIFDRPGGSGAPVRPPRNGSPPRV